MTNVKALKNTDWTIVVLVGGQRDMAHWGDGGTAKGLGMDVGQNLSKELGGSSGIAASTSYILKYSSTWLELFPVHYYVFFFQLAQQVIAQSIYCILYCTCFFFLYI